MEITATHVIALVSVLFTLLMAEIGLIGFLIRLDNKANQTKTDLDCLEKEKVDELAKKFEAHRENNAIHSSDLINYKLNTMERALDDVRATMMKGFDKIDSTLNKVLGIDK